MRDKEKQLIVSHEVSLDPFKIEPTGSQRRIPQDSRAICLQTGWQGGERKAVTTEPGSGFNFF